MLFKYIKSYKCIPFYWDHVWCKIKLTMPISSVINESIYNTLYPHASYKRDVTKPQGICYRLTNKLWIWKKLEPNWAHPSMTEYTVKEKWKVGLLCMDGDIQEISILYLPGISTACNGTSNGIDHQTSPHLNTTSGNCIFPEQRDPGAAHACCGS